MLLRGYVKFQKMKKIFLGLEKKWYTRYKSKKNQRKAHEYGQNDVPFLKIKNGTQNAKKCRISSIHACFCVFGTCTIFHIACTIFLVQIN